jgi:hypothetical protein
MTDINGNIGANARGEFPTTFKVLADDAVLGADQIIRVIQRVESRLFGRVLTDSEETALDPVVADYAGKLVVLQLINPAIDYWSKQPLSLGATGRNENKSYDNRARDLLALRTQLLEATRLMWPEVQALLPERRFDRVNNAPRVQQGSGVLTPDPFGIERPFVDPNVAPGG